MKPISQCRVALFAQLIDSSMILLMIELRQVGAHISQGGQFGIRFASILRESSACNPERLLAVCDFSTGLKALPIVNLCSLL